ncbi:MAG: DUF72 domain-containing protein [Actinobacteria bacterium]|nr:MAG: DUF72 domain-containing protein [Actinomycetota bacterium]
MIFVGTSGWQYASWRGRFYPKGVPQRAWLAHYATHFPVVEVNNSFYVLPKESTFDRWRQESPGRFLFVVKASRYITHIRRLRNAKDSVDRFWSRAARLGEKLGPVLFQLPPNFRADAGVLNEFLAALPGPMRAAFEFRDDSWQHDEVYELLDRAGAAWVMADRPGWRVPTIVTGGWSYLRFHQGRRTHPGYARSKLRAWADRIAGLDARDVFAFFNNDASAAAPKDARTLMDLLLDKAQDVALPQGG